MVKYANREYITRLSACATRAPTTTAIDVTKLSASIRNRPQMLIELEHLIPKTDVRVLNYMGIEYQIQLRIVLQLQVSHTNPENTRPKIAKVASKTNQYA